VVGGGNSRGREVGGRKGEEWLLCLSLRGGYDAGRWLEDARGKESSGEGVFHKVP